MRRLGLVAISLSMFVACSSEDGGAGGDLERDAPDAQASSDGAAGADGAGRAPDASVDARADAPSGTEFSGQATYYAADGRGACGFKATPNDLMVAAMNGAQYNKGWCGQCVLVTGPKGTSIKVRIVDLCPGCAQGGLDLSKEAFAAISPLSAGRIKITWHVVPC